MSKIEFLTFVDTETTGKEGPDKFVDSVVEVAMAKVRLSDRMMVHYYTSLIRPHGFQSLSPTEWDFGAFHKDAGHFNGVDWREAPCLHDVLRDVGVTIRGATLAGQNPAFDERHLRREFSMYGMTFPKIDYHRIDLCSPAIFLHMQGKTEGLSLRYSAKHFGRPKQQHRAMADVNDAIAVFWAMYDTFTGARNGFPPDVGPWNG